MLTLIFATNNQNKVKEIRSLLGSNIQIITLKEAGIDIEIPEPHQSLEENATEKSSVIHRLTNKNCFSEDTGLEVEALNGEPGVRSARYAGDEANFKKNIHKLLQHMQGKKNRQARFRTVISLIIDDTEYLFEGICKGLITETETGENGFGYDPIFIPEPANKTFAQMSLEEKNQYSHRKKAMDKLIVFLKEKYGEG